MKNKVAILKWPLLGILLFINNWGWAQGEEAPVASSDFLSFIYHNLILIIGFTVVLAAFISIFYLINVMLQMQKIRLLQEHGVEALEETKLISKTPLWKRLYQRWTAVVPIDKEKDILLNHDYDGIRELDNKLPPWWVAVFYLSIGFGFVYLFTNHWSSNSVSSREAYAIEMEEADQAIKVYLSKQADQVDETNATMIVEPDQLAVGQQVFEINCAVCHGPVGEGASVGPNLVDQYWKHGGGVQNIFRTVKYGVPEAGMIAWKSQLRAQDIHRVASYIWSLQGSNPTNQKEAEGELYIEEKPMTSDSLSEEDSEMTGMNDQ